MQSLVLQFERTLIVADEDSQVSYLEGCTAPSYDKNQVQLTPFAVFFSHDLLCMQPPARQQLLCSQLCADLTDVARHNGKQVHMTCILCDASSYVDVPIVSGPIVMPKYFAPDIPSLENTLSHKCAIDVCYSITHIAG